MPRLRIIADESIPLVRELFKSMGSVQLAAGHALTREDVRDVDVLLVRSVTRVDAELLEGSAVRFVGTATIGVDHIETEFLHQHEIAWASAPGSNADSVVEYVLAALLRLAVRQGEPLRGRTLGIIGFGNIGRRLARRSEALGLSILKNDPPLEEADRAAGRPAAFLELYELLRQSDVVTCHVPLTRRGAHPTWHLIGEDELAAMRPEAWLINTSRGAVIDNAALLRALDRPDEGPGAVVLDVWEDEPSPLEELVARVDIGTPHIAGYSYEGKVAGTVMLLEALARHLGVRVPETDGIVDTSVLFAGAPDPGLPETEWLDQLVRRMYDIGVDDRRMRSRWPAAGEAGPYFTRLRRAYPKRRTFGAFRIQTAQVPPAYRELADAGVGVRLRTVSIRTQE